MTVVIEHGQGGVVPDPETTGQSLQAEFLTTDEFSGILDRHIERVRIDPGISETDIKFGFKGEVVPVDDPSTAKKDGKPTAPRYVIRIAAQLSTQERARTLLRELDNVRIAVYIRENGPILTTGGEDILRSTWKEKGVEEFYTRNQELVDSYLQQAAMLDISEQA